MSFCNIVSDFFFIVFPLLLLIHSNLKEKLVLTGASVITAIVLQFITSCNSTPFSQKENFAPKNVNVNSLYPLVKKASGVGCQLFHRLFSSYFISLVLAWHGKKSVFQASNWILATFHLVSGSVFFWGLFSISQQPWWWWTTGAGTLMFSISPSGSHLSRISHKRSRRRCANGAV